MASRFPAMASAASTGFVAARCVAARLLPLHRAAQPPIPRGHQDHRPFLPVRHLTHWREVAKGGLATGCRSHATSRAPAATGVEGRRVTPDGYRSWMAHEQPREINPTLYPKLP